MSESAGLHSVAPSGVAEKSRLINGNRTGGILPCVPVTPCSLFLLLEGGFDLLAQQGALFLHLRRAALGAGDSFEMSQGRL